MKLQVIYDSGGNKIGVFIPYRNWNKLKEQYTALGHLESSNKCNLNNIAKGLREVSLFERGKLKTTSAKDFLDQL